MHFEEKITKIILREDMKVKRKKISVTSSSPYLDKRKRVFQLFGKIFSNGLILRRP
jgi:hypothetical protein